MRRDTWLHELAHELTARGVAETDVAGIVVEAEGHLHETATAPLDAFGSPAAYAALVVDALEPHVERSPGRTRVRARGVSKRFGAHRVLDAIDLDLRDGEAVLLMGANGAGKSTLLRSSPGSTRRIAGRARDRRPGRLRAAGRRADRPAPACAELSSWAVDSAGSPAAALAHAAATIALCAAVTVALTPRRGPAALRSTPARRA